MVTIECPCCLDRDDPLARGSGVAEDPAIYLYEDGSWYFMADFECDQCKCRFTIDLGMAKAWSIEEFSPACEHGKKAEGDGRTLSPRLKIELGSGSRPGTER
jgi:hypothetical protein